MANKRNSSLKSANQLNIQLQTYRSLINTIKNESIDKQNDYKGQVWMIDDIDIYFRAEGIEIGE